MIKEKEQLHLRVIRDLNLKYIQPLLPSSAWVYKVRERGKTRTIKIADHTDFLDVFEDMNRENEALQRTIDVPGVAKLVSFQERMYDDLRLRILVREYVDGKVLYDENGHVERLNKDQRARLESTVRALHEKGLANLDIKETNVVLSSRIPHIIDLGTTQLRDCCSDAVFESYIQVDLKELNWLCRRYGI